MRARYPKASHSLLLSLGFALGLSAAQAALAQEPVSSATEEAPLAEPAAAPKPARTRMSGEKVYNEVCIACHYPPGLGGAPGLGNVEAWAPRIAQGKDTLISHALNGFSGKSGGIMPKKGGRVDLSDEEIVGALEYMLGKASP